MSSILHAISSAIQFLLGLLTPMFGVAAFRWLIRPRANASDSDLAPSAGRRFAFTLLVALPCMAVFGLTAALQEALPTAVATAAATDAAITGSTPEAIGATAAAAAILTRILFELITMAVGYGIVIWQGTETRPEYRSFSAGLRFRFGLWKAVGTLILLMLSLLPLSALLLAFPAVARQETVLTEAVDERQSWWRRMFGRIASLALALTVLIALLAVATEIVTRLVPAEKGPFGIIARTLLPTPKSALPFITSSSEYWNTPLYTHLPPAMVEHWPIVFLTVYLLDLGVLLILGNVPLAYNLRNVQVRWRTNFMTALAFAGVIALLSFLLAFVNGMNNLTDNTGIPGNVFCLSDGSTDEIFSNLGYGELDNVETQKADEEQLLDAAGKPVLDAEGKTLWRPIRPIGIKQIQINGKPRYLASKETYYSINMPVPNSDRRRFVQLRTMKEIEIAAEVHNMKLYPGGRWFTSAGGDAQGRIECVLGDGIAGTLGPDVGKKRLGVGDEFILGDMRWVVVGIMNAEGTTFGSEIWTHHADRVYKAFGKEKFTTLVLRTEADTREASKVFANWLTQKYTQQKFRAFSEPDYYAELTKTNNFFLVAIIIVCVVMALGGVVGMMTTMFASIAQRIRDIGVLRLLGFKRWQVMVSFLLESLAIAMIGGAIGLFFAWLVADGRESTSNLSSGGGGPGGKSVALKISVDYQVMAMGMLCTLVMGRLGGLVPALGATRMKILDSLR